MPANGQYLQSSSKKHKQIVTSEVNDRTAPDRPIIICGEMPCTILDFDPADFQFVILVETPTDANELALAMAQCSRNGQPGVFKCFFSHQKSGRTQPESKECIRTSIAAHFDLLCSLFNFPLFDFPKFLHRVDGPCCSRCDPGASPEANLVAQFVEGANNVDEALTSKQFAFLRTLLNHATPKNVDHFPCTLILFYRWRLFDFVMSAVKDPTKPNRSIVVCVLMPSAILDLDPANFRFVLLVETPAGENELAAAISLCARDGHPGVFKCFVTHHKHLKTKFQTPALIYNPDRSAGDTNRKSDSDASPEVELVARFVHGASNVYGFDVELDVD
ncbi:hypothetical protein GGF32_003376 [Allomyces javanicus]|nr:hypothetical protein GGF32_003376 [Allomyces javanicus]